MPMSANVTPTTPLEPNAQEAVAFLRSLFREGETVHFRAVSEPKDSRPSTNSHYAVDKDFEHNVEGFLRYTTVSGMASFFLPGNVTSGKTGKGGVISLPAVLVDLDKGNPAKSLAAMEDEYGPVSVVVESGGTTSEGHRKLHCYYILDCPAMGADIQRACAVRLDLATRFNGDPAFRQEAQVIRVPGSIHFKNGAQLVRIVRQSEVRYPLAQFSASRPDNVVRPAAFNFDFSQDRPDTSDVERVLTQPTHEGAVDDLTRFEAIGKAIGHFLRMVREGRSDLAGAWEAVKDFNQARIVPPWDETRLRGDFDRLAEREKKTGGPFVPVLPAVETASTGALLTDWHARRFKSPAPKREWLVDGLIPRGTPGVFAAVGDAGKSMLALRLAHIVGNYPVPLTTADSPAGITDAPSFFGKPVIGRGAAVFLTGEDDGAEVSRRLDAVDPTGMRFADSSRLYVQPLLSTGGARAIVTAGRNGPELTPFWLELRAQLLALPDLALVVLDPLTQFVGADTNDNTIGAAFMGEMNKLAAETGAAVVLIHHLAKAGTGRITGLSDARNAVLGASAWVNNSRWALVLWEADRDDTRGTLKELGQQHRGNEAGLVYFGGLSKSNAPGAKVTRTMVRNGATGMLEDKTDELRALAPKSDDVDAVIHRELWARQLTNSRLSFTASPSALWAEWEPIIRRHNLPITKEGKGKKDGVRAVFDRLLDAGLLVQTQDGSRTPRYAPVERVA